MQALPSVTINLALDHRDQVTADREQAVSWDVLTRYLTDHHRRPDKFHREDGFTAFSLARFSPERCTCGDPPAPGHAGCPDHPKNNPTNTPRGHRIARNVLGVTAIGIDFDLSASGGRLTQAEAAQVFGTFQARGIAAVAYSSHSHAPPDDCHYRVVVAISRELSVDEFNRLRHYVPQYLGIPAGCTSDARHIWFAPSCPPSSPDAPGPAPEAYVFPGGGVDGYPLDVDALLATVPAAVPKDSGRIVEPTDAPPTAQQEAALEILAEHWPPVGTRNDARGELAGALAWHGWAEDDISEFLDRLAVRTNDGILKAEVQSANARWARGSVAGVQTEGRVTGWPTLAKRIGEDVVRDVKRALGYEPVPKSDPDFVAAINALGAKSPSSFLAQFASASASTSASESPTTTVAEPTPTAPTPDQILAALESARDKLKRHASESDKYASRLLARVLKNDIFPDEEEFKRAVVVVATTVPAGATAANVQAIVSACASGAYITRLEEIAQDAVKIADQVRAARSTFSAVDKNGVPKPDSADNIRTALDLSDVRLSYDAFADREMIQEGDEPCVPIEDHHVYRLADTWERKHGFVIKSTSKLHNTISVIAREHRYHPVLDYLDALPSVTPEDVNLPQEWLIRFAGAKDTPYVRAVSQLMLVAAVRRVRRPGAKFDEMLVLEGDQGSSKSRALRHLVPNEDLFTDAIKLGMEAKEVMEIVVGRWVVEIPEMHKMGADSLVKGMLSKQEDSARMSYGRRRHTQRRHFVIVGTTNEKQYLTDRTGNRRYWPIAVGEVDVDGLVEARDRIWAAAVAVETADSSEACIRLPKELWPVAAEEQEQRRQKSSTELSLVGALTPYGTDEYAGVQVRIRAEDVRHIALGGGSPHRADHIEIRDVMQKLGWNFIESARWPGTKRFGGVWRRGDEGQASKIYLEVETDQRGAFSDLRERVVDKAVKAPVFSGVN